MLKVIVSKTSIELAGPLKFFALSRKALRVVRQLKTAKQLEFKKKRFWTTHYTITLWSSKEDMAEFAYSGAHMEVMKKGKETAKEIRTISLTSDKLPNWTEAKKLLQNGKVIRY